MKRMLLSATLALGACHSAPPPAAPCPAPVAATPAPHAAGAMTGILARFKILPGKEDEAFALFRDTAAQVQAAEPQTLVYLFFRTKTDPQEIVVFEVYADADARKTHNMSEIMKATHAKLPEVIDMQSIKLEGLDSSVIGFER